MKKFLSILLAALLLLTVFVGCGTTEKPEAAGQPQSAAPATEDHSGVYSFTELALGGALEVPFTVELKADGSYVITEANPVMGEQTYTGTSYAWKDTYFTTGAMDGDARPEAGWFDADGSCVWIIEGDGAVIPMKYVAPSEGTAPAADGALSGALGGPSAGVYTYAETNAFGMAIDWTLDLHADGTYALSEVNTMFPDGKSYEGTAWQQDGSTVSCGAMVSGPDIFDWANPAGFTAVLGDGVFTPNTDGAAVVLSGGSGSTSDANYAAVAYAENSAAQVLDVYLPEGEGPFPVIVLFHGGGFKFGDQAMSIIQPVIKAGTANGYAVVSADYRKSGEAVFPAALADAKAAVRWVRANATEYGFDTEKIAVWGESAGAYLAAMTALTPEISELNGDVTANADVSSAVTALVDFYGPIDFWTMDADSEEVGISANTGDAGSFESAFLGQAVAQDEQFTRRTWWKTYEEKIPAGLQVWIQAGDSDQRVPCLQSVHFGEQLAEKLGAGQVKSALIPGADHEDDLFYAEENLADVFAWLDPLMK